MCIYIYMYTKSNYNVGDTILITISIYIYTHYGNLIQVPWQQPQMRATVPPISVAGKSDKRPWESVGLSARGRGGLGSGLEGLGFRV